MQGIVSREFGREVEGRRKEVAGQRREIENQRRYRQEIAREKWEA